MTAVAAAVVERPASRDPGRAARQAAWVALAQEGDQRAAGLAIRDVEGVVRRVARSFQRRYGQAVGDAYEDMVAEAKLVIFEKAIPLFRADLGAWTTYVSWWATFACRRWLCDGAHVVRVPRSARNPQPVIRCESLDEPQYLNSGDAFYPIDSIVDDSPLPGEERLEDYLDGVPEHLAEILRDRAAGMTLEEVGLSRGVSKERARQVEEQAIAWVRAKVEGRRVRHRYSACRRCGEQGHIARNCRRERSRSRRQRRA